MVLEYHYQGMNGETTPKNIERVIVDSVKKIGEEAFAQCYSLQRLRISSRLNKIGQGSFEECYGLVEADLLATSVREIPHGAFLCCISLQAVSLPKPIVRLCATSFYGCESLVSVIVPQDCNPIRIGHVSFGRCSDLVNMVLPPGSTAKYDSFEGCTLLEDRFGREQDNILYGLEDRFDYDPVHMFCYDRSGINITLEELGQSIETRISGGSRLVDDFGMTPFHILFSTIDPCMQLLEVLLDKLPYYVLGRKDANDKLALEYLVTNWTRGNRVLLQMSLHQWMLSRLDRWHSKSWRTRTIPLVNDLLAEDDKELRMSYFSKACSVLKQCENVESLSILEMALWKVRLRHGWSRDGTRRRALDRQKSRCFCGAHIVIPNVLLFLRGWSN
ncbi:unnamed protein product [Cylindrotheca closterium]|uniref:Uncharacterized protein n=1 Tax=Cylindrotheca closterium TaxID=2856 RepID=A0AAD2G0X8_9STRA|nr:unnamed protein product [Cylindrotheca closterium]